MKRTPLRRLTPLRSGHPVRRLRPIRQRARKPRVSGEYSDLAYLAWLRDQPCRVPGCHGKAIPHHLRHTATGAAMGARIKDDRRAISLCDRHHTGDVGIHTVPWRLCELVKCELRAWQDRELAEQRVEYLRASARCAAVVS